MPAFFILCKKAGENMSDGTIIIDTKIDHSGAEKGVSNLSNKLNGIAKTGLKALTTGIAAAGTALSGFGVASVKLASDLEEVQNVVDVTFGDNSGKINEWAKKAATSFGMSELEAKQFNGTMGAMLKSMGLTGDKVLDMSENMTGLAGDFASFYNLDPKESFDKIRAGISGETEPLKQLGINMSVANLEAYALSKGINKQYSEMTQAEQATLRYNYLMSVSADAQGDFARTSDSLANQLRIAKLGIKDLSGAIGTALMPAAQEAVKSLNGMIGELKGAFDKGGFQGLANKLGDVVAQMITGVAAQLPNVIGMGVNIMQSLITGIENNLPSIAGSVVKVIASLTEGFLKMLPQLLIIGMQAIGQLVIGIGQQLPTLIPLAVQCIMELIQGFYNNIPLIIQCGLELLSGLATGIINAIPVLIAMLPRVINSIISCLVTALPMIMQKGIEILLALINGIVEAMPQLIAMLPTIINTIIGFILNNLPGILDMGIQVLLALINGLVNAIPQLIAMLPQIINAIISTLIANLPQIISAGIEIIVALAKGLLRAIPNLVGAIPEIIKAIWHAFTEIDWWDLGSNIIKGIGSGIAGAVKGLVGTAIEACRSLKDSVKEFFGIHSPSTLMRDLIGVNLMRGIGVGVEMETPDLQKQIDDNLDDLYAGLRMTVDAETARTTASIVAGNQIVQKYIVNETENSIKDGEIFIIKNYMDSEQISEYTYKKVDGRLALAGKRVR